MVKEEMKFIETGYIIQDWDDDIISNFASTSSGGTPSRSIASYYEGNIKWLTTSELRDNLIDDSIEYISEAALKNSSAKIFPQDTVLMAMYGATIGRLGILTTESATNQACCAMMCNPKKCDYKYLFYSLQGMRDYIISLGSGAGQPNISQNIVKNLRVALPDLEEQKTIATALSDIDELIDNLEKLIEKKKNIKQGAMQELLTGKKRLPGFTNNWEEAFLNDISSSMTDGPFGSDLKTEHYTSEHEVRLIQLSNIGEDGWNNDNTKYTTYEHANELSRCKVKPGDIVIAKMMPAGRTIICPDIEKDYILASDVVKFVPNEKVNSKYFVYATKSEFFLEQVAENTQGSTRARTSISKLRKISIMLPDIEEQQAIANLLGDMDNEINMLCRKLAKTKLLKQGMMQKLLTGEIRLV